jgi:(2Fe-2S) ferredoxin
MGYYEKHIFVCENERESNHPLGSCAQKGSVEITNALKKKCRESGLMGKVRVNKSGCLGQCSKGPVLVIYPEGEWCENVAMEDVNKIFDEKIKL